jgi:Bacterial archaeo-eukaryotic release factor family 2
MNLAGIQRLYHHDGPFVNLHVDVSRESEAAARGMESRWNTISRQLAEAGADPGPLDQLGGLVRKPSGLPGEARRTVVAEGEEIVFDDVRMGHGAWPEVTDVGPLPDLSGWLAQVDGEFPFVLVVADREGADIDVYRAVSEQRQAHESVQGQTLHVHKVPAGDWAELQGSTEEVWRRNARLIADASRTVAKEYGARLALLAGEVRARAEISRALQSGGNLQVVEVEGGGRAPGSSADALWDEANTAIGQQWAEDRQHVMDRLEEQSGQDHAVARGLRNVMQALERGQVERLVLDLHSAHEQTIAPGDFPGIRLPAAAAQAGRLAADQALVAVGAMTDADLTVLPVSSVGGDGIAALLRWEDQPA